MKLQALVSEPANANQVNLALTSNFGGVIRWSTPVLVTSNGAGSVVVVRHDLGTVPNGILVIPFVDSRWWADADDRRMWNAATVTFHVSAPDGQYSVQAGVW